jgi:peptide chain release factor subunit 1
VVLDGKDATVAILKGKGIRILRRLHSTAHSKFKKGGQSAARFGRIREEEIEAYYKRVGEAMVPFLGEKDFKGVIVGGPGPVKDDFLKAKPFNYQLKVLGVVDTGYAAEFGLKELMEKSDDLIAEQEAVIEQKLVEELMREVVKGGKAAYGYADVKASLGSNKVSKLLVSEGLLMKKIVFKCSQCGKTVERIVVDEKGTEVANAEAAEEPCECGGKMRMAQEIDVVKELLDAAEKGGVDIEIVSTETPSGKQFLATLHGLGALLRY